MFAEFLAVINLLVSDLQLPDALRTPLVQATASFVPTPVALIPATKIIGSAPAPAALPQKVRNAGDFKLRAKRGIILDADTAEVLFAKNSDQKAPMASIAKLMVALEAVDRAKSMEQVLTVPKQITKLDPESSVAGFKTGEKVTVQDLLTALLVSSANDAAVTLAAGLAGSEKKFVEGMNQRAMRLGLTNTHFANATGLDAPGNESTARDLAFLLLTAEREPLIKQLTTLAGTTIVTQDGNTYYLKPTDQLLGSSDYLITAAKTGTTDKAGASFVVMGVHNGRRTIAVIMDSPERFTEAESALRYAFESFSASAAAVSQLGG